MAEQKTKATKQSVKNLIDAIEHKTRSADAKVLLSMMEAITKQPAVLWGSSIIGFGQYHYEYESGCKGDWMKTGFSVQKTKVSIYLINGFSEYAQLLSQLGKHKLGKSCLYINKLADVDLDILRQLIKESYEYMCNKYS
jgi:hypothetical protein